MEPSKTHPCVFENQLMAIENLETTEERDYRLKHEAFETLES
jgi:hypothetical protein